MAGDDLLNFNVDLSGAGSVAADVITYIVLIAIIGGALYLIYYLTSFRNKLIIRDLANGRKIIKTGVWKEIKDKNNVYWLVTPFNKIKKPLPPADAIDITPKGRKFVEAYRGEDSDTLLWITDNFDYKSFKQEMVSTFQPLITQERELLVNEIVKGYSYEKKNTWDRVLQVLPWLVPVILVIVVAVTLEDITGALAKYSGPITSSLESTARSFEAAAEKLGNTQTAGLNNDAVNIIGEAPN